jgi:NADP-dependent aldehyde dehydrogenase
MDGSYLIGGQRRTSAQTFQGIEAATGQALPGDFAVTTPEDLALACTLAEQAFDHFRETAPETRATFLEAIATALEKRSEAIVARAMLESGLPQGRLNGELGRTTGQLRLFASVVREGDWAGVVIDKALPERAPLPRPDLRSRQIPVGPVAVFGASNFPWLSAWRAATPLRPLPPDAPSWSRHTPPTPAHRFWSGKPLPKPSSNAAFPPARSASFRNRVTRWAPRWSHTRDQGRGLHRLAQRRPCPDGGGRSPPEPIPVYAEMSSINPVVLLPAALAARAPELGRAYVASLSLFAGQFCTNPGILIA